MIYTDGRYIVADTLQELHKFAKSIGLNRQDNFHNPTSWRNDKEKAYYLTEYARITDKAIKKGAKKITTRQVVKYANGLPATDIYESKIQEYLFKHFENYTYKLTNSIVFAWESDFLCRSDSSYFVETEIKISRSDFFADFNKPKHKLFEALRAGKKILVETRSWGEKHGDIIATYRQPLILSNYGPFRRFGGYRKNDHNNWEYCCYNGKWGCWVNDWGNTNVTYEEKKVYAPVSTISYIKLEERQIPHQFYFAVPAGLVDKSEIPDYAGLLYVKNKQIKMIKKAPYLHKREMNLDSILLTKFHALWAFKQTMTERIEMTELYNEKQNESGQPV